MPIMSFANSVSSRRAKASLLGLLLVAACLFQGPALAAEEGEETKASIRAFVERVNEASMNFFAGGSEDDARERVRALLASSFDVPGMAEYALARAWEKASPEQREELLEAFREEIVTAYLRRMHAPGTKLEFVGHRKPVGEEHLAASRRIVPGKPDQIWIWWMKQDGDSWRITDLSADGHSALSTQRQEYGSVYIDNNEDIDAVLEFMRTRAARPIESE
jgi:phospholipid transport system substrate-binding protein